MEQTQKAPDEYGNRPKENMAVGKKRTLLEKWRLTSLSNKTISIATVVIAGASLLQFGTAFFQWQEMNSAGKQTDQLIYLYRQQAQAAVDLAKATQDSIKLAKENFQEDQRPYLWRLTSRAYPITDKQKISYDIFFANYGKSPAINERSVTNLFFGKEAMSQAESWFAKHGDTRLTGGSVGIVPPGIPPTIETVPSWTSAISNKIPSKDEVEYILKTDKSVVVVARVEYFDTGGNFYRSDMCFYRLASGPIASCLQHNEIK